MNKKLNLNKLDQIAIPPTNKWKEKAKEIVDSKAWLEDAAVIAVRVMNALEEQDLTQRDLAKRLDVTPQAVNKIVKGRQNLTLGTIRKLEAAIGISLIRVRGNSPVNSKAT